MKLYNSLVFKGLAVYLLSTSFANAVLVQEQTNGNSTYGTIAAPRMTTKFLPPVGGESSSVAGTFEALLLNQNVRTTNTYSVAPSTGQTRQYDLHLTRSNISPDGVLKSVILINNQFPGPTIAANRGDMIEVTVHNDIRGPEEGTGIHWHGILQKDTPWEDGVPSVHGCPIPPGESYTYKFKADIWGTSWYHSHYSGQTAGGAYGPLIIYGPLPVLPYDDELVITLGDYYHEEYYSILKRVVGNDTNPYTNFSSFVPASDNSLISGKMNYNCSLGPPPTSGVCVPDAGLAEFSLSSNKTTRLRLINTGSDGMIYFGIDKHKLTVITNDFVDIVPYETDVVTLAVGQRTDVLVTADQDPSVTYYMRSSISHSLGCGAQNMDAHYDHIGQREGLAVVGYNVDPNSQARLAIPENITAEYLKVENAMSSECANDDLAKTQPIYAVPAESPTITYNIPVQRLINETGHANWTINGVGFKGNYSDPVILHLQENDVLPTELGRPFTFQENVFDIGKNIYLDANSTVRLHIYNFEKAHHPMHLHGHNMQILDQGDGMWDGITIVNPENPQRRDTQSLPIQGYIVVQFQTDNPGVWPLHCHNAWHTSAGLYMNILERPDEIEYQSIPGDIQQLCQAWNTRPINPASDDPDIDSGV